MTEADRELDELASLMVTDEEAGRIRRCREIVQRVRKEEARKREGFEIREAHWQRRLHEKDRRIAELEDALGGIGHA